MPVVRSRAFSTMRRDLSTIFLKNNENY
jgi:hypothetical protein